MKFFNFHLMPYAHVDLDAIAKNGSAWVTFSNSHYDPEKGAELYHDYLDQMEFADQLGFDGVCLNEHHQTAYGMMPIPGVLAGALARSVKHAKIAILGRALPLHEQSADHRRRIRDARQSHARPHHRRLRARHRRRVSLHRHQSGQFAGALCRGARPDRARLDRARAVRLFRQALSVPLRQSVAAALSDAASADLDSVARLRLDDPLGGEDALHLLPDARARSPRWRDSSSSIATRPTRPATRRRPTSSPGRTRSMSARPTRRRCARRKPHLEALVNYLPQNADRDAAAAGLHRHRLDEARARRQGHRQDGSRSRT